MSLAIRGLGWVTPLGSSVPEVWQRIVHGDQATAEKLTNPFNERAYTVFRVPVDAIASAPAHPRLRRASAISRFAAAAGLAALADADLKLDPESAARTAIIFAIANGGVIYTKRFYHEVVETGAQAASPLLFPETVFNAPASHLAAILGITGASYTLVGDGAVGVLAVQMAQDLLGNPELDRCLVVGAEEADWLLCDAYDQWRLLRDEPPIEVFEPRPRGTILSEGAGAVLLARDGSVEIERIDSGGNFRRQSEAADCLEQTLARLPMAETDLIAASANGTFIDRAEKSAFAKHASGARIFTPKQSLGESVGASALWQTICAAQALRAGSNEARRAIVSACGLNQQVAALALRASRG